MRLMEPSPGESVDRITILELKIKNSDRQEFKDELTSIRKYLVDKKFNIPNELGIRLGQINTRLWDLEDRQRELMDKATHISTSPREEFCNNAIYIVQLNDARAETVRKINVACGIDSVEKLHDTIKNS